MKKRLLSLMAFLGVFILWGCPNNVTPPEPDTLEPVKTEYNVGAEGGEFTISFRTNLEYKVRTDANWLEATAVTKAVETKTATVKVKPNPDAEPRTGHVTVEAGSLSTVITVVQSALKPEINITPSSGYNDIPAAGGSFSVDVSSNVSYEVSVSESWIKQSGTSGSVVNFTVEPNEAYTDRTGTVVFKYGEVSKTLSIKQNKKEKEPDYIDIQITNYPIAADGGTVSVVVSSNAAYTISAGESWVKASGKAGGAETFTVEANGSEQARSCTVTFQTGETSKSIVIAQEGKEKAPEPFINLGTTAVDVEAAGKTFSIAVNSNVEYDAVADVEWITAAGGTNENRTFAVSANDTYEERTGVITFSGSGASAKATVVQRGKERPYINVPTTAFSLSAAGGPLTIVVNSNVEYATACDADWIAAEGNVFTVAANEASEQRVATITFSYEDVSKTVTVTQYGTVEPDVLDNAGHSTYRVPAEGDNIEVIVRTNVEYTVEVSVDWITKVESRAVREDKILFAVEASEVEAERTGEISFTYGTGSEALSFVVTVTQEAYVPPAPDPVLEISIDNLTLGSDASQHVVNVTANYPYTVETAADWVTAVKTEDGCTVSVAANAGTQGRQATVVFKSEDLEKTLVISQEGKAEVEDPVFELLDTEAEIGAEGGELEVKVNSNFDYTVVAADAWVSVGEKTGSACTLVVEANTDRDSRMATVLFDGNQQFYIVQAGAVSEDDPFDVGSDLSIHGTANCYVVTKAGSYTFDASVMGNGESGYDLWDESQLEVLHLWPKTQAAVSFKSSVYSANTKPRTVEVLWDDNNVIDGEPTMSNMVVSFKATGNKGNALLATRNRSGDICWSWHIWCTDSPRQKRMYDLEENEYALLDRNLGATSADAADGDKTWGLYYQFGRKDPLRGYIGLAADLQECQENVYESIKNPTAYYGGGSKTVEWFNTGPNLSFVTADLWGNPSYKWQANQDFPVPPHDFPASRSELKKTIYDPCPPGYMVPPPMAWEMITKNDLRVTDDGVYMPTFDGESFYPFAGFLSPLNTTEMGYEYTLGWFAFKGMRETTWARRSTHTIETVVAAVYTSQTGSYDWWVDTHGQWEMFGGSYIEAYIEESDPVTFENLRFKLGHRVRVYGYPVRCVKEFND